MKNFNFDFLKKDIKNKLHHPDTLLTRKTGPVFLKMSTSAFDKLRKSRPFKEYEHLSTKFFNKDEVQDWAYENRPFIFDQSFKLKKSGNGTNNETKQTRVA